MVGGKGGFSYINSKGLVDYSEHAKKAGIRHSYMMKNDALYREKYMKKMKAVFTDTAYRSKRSEIAKRMHREGILSNANTQTEESREKRKSTFREIGHQQGRKNSQFGTCWITNGIENKKIKKEELDIWLKCGYNIGRVVKKC